MKLTTIAISNIRSFSYSTSPQEIPLSQQTLNFIIGPNGSGKSNLIEILTRLFTHFYGSDVAEYNHDARKLISTTDHKTDMNGLRDRPSTFAKHRDFGSQESYIRLKIILDQSDIDNLKLVKHNAIQLNAIYKWYFKVQNGKKRIFEYDFELPEVGSEHIIELADTEDTGYEKIFKEKNSESIISLYLSDYRWINTTIDIYNQLIESSVLREIEKTQPRDHNYKITLDELGIEQGSTKLKELTPIVLLMSVQERLNQITLDYNQGIQDGVSGQQSTFTSKKREIERQIHGKTALGTYNTNQSQAFEVLKRDIYSTAIKLLEGRRSTAQVIATINKTHQELADLNALITTFRLKIILKEFHPARGNITLELLEGDKPAAMLDLSTGQQAIVNIASNLLLAKKYNCLILIDEIENHLYPKAQKRLKESLVKLTSTDAQVVAITHSPIFIDRLTLGYTTRLSMIGATTKAQQCSAALTRDAKALVNVLQYTNGARIFFTDKVLLVEGPSDEEFFSAYIQKFYPDFEVEVLNTGGKGTTPKWKAIILQFGIEVFTITDLDNAKRGEIKRKPDHPKKENVSICKDDVDPDEYKILLNNILKRRISKEYVLAEGAVESYIPKKLGDKLQNMRDFLAENNWSRLKHKEELKQIFDNMTS